MGGEHSQFEQQFYHLYRFIGVVQDKLFHSVKIYRRTKFNFDYIMLVERPLAEFTTNSINSNKQYVAHRLQLIRKYQNSYTVGLSYSTIIDGGKLKCEGAIVRLYIEYYNHNLNDYLNALRTSKLYLTYDELVFVTNSLVEATIALKKMEIEQFVLTLQNIQVSADQGKVVLNPIHFFYENAILGSYNLQVKQLSKDYQPLDLAASTSRAFNQKNLPNTPEQLQINNILTIFMEASRYLRTEELIMAHHLFALLGRAKSVKDMLAFLTVKCEQLRVDQFVQARQPLHLYSNTGSSG